MSGGPREEGGAQLSGHPHLHCLVSNRTSIQTPLWSGRHLPQPTSLGQKPLIRPPPGVLGGTCLPPHCPQALWEKQELLSPQGLAQSTIRASRVNDPMNKGTESKCWRGEVSVPRHTLCTLGEERSRALGEPAALCPTCATPLPHLR